MNCRGHFRLGDAWTNLTAVVVLVVLILPGNSGAQTAPAISVQPRDQSIVEGGNAAFNVVASGQDPLAYQWYFGEVPLSDSVRLTGSSSPALTIRNVGPGDAGGYSAVVSNAWGSVTSSVVTLSLATIRYVNVNNPNPAAPYTNWATAATVIQDAIDVSAPGDEVIVTNGVYQSGSVSAGTTYYAGHRIALNKPISVMSVNGPEVTIIVARTYPYPAFGRRCAYLTNGAMLAGFTLTGGETDLGNTSAENQRGAGVLCQSVDCVVSNCVITGNVAGRFGGGAFSGTLIQCTIANNSARDLGGARTGNGGGTYGSNLRNCVLVSNSARYGGGGACASSMTNCVVSRNSAVWGGGAYVSTLVNCTVVGNSAYDDGGLGGAGGGGIASGTLWNSIVVQNSAPYGTPNYYSGSMAYCIAWPAHDGEGNLEGDPAFVDYAGGNYHLQATSPCISAGTNGVVALNTDLDGRPRVVDSVVDIGAYEFQHAPWVVLGPTSQGVVLGSNALLSVTSVGDEPLAYYWRKDGVNLSDDGRIAGSSTAALSVSAVSLQDAGAYQVIVSNAIGSATSAVASLTILLPPAIISQPADILVAVGATGSFEAAVGGTSPLSYQWRKDGVNMSDGGNISGAASPTLQLSNAGTNDVGGYDVVVANPYGSATSVVARLSLIPLGITNQPLSLAVPAGTNAGFVVGVSGLPPFSYQWRFNGAELPGQTNSRISLSNVQSWNAGEYDVVVTNLYSVLTSTVATLTVESAPPLISTQAASRVASVGQDVFLRVGARGSEPMGWQWQRDGNDIAGGTSPTLVISNVNCGFNGAYRAAVSNDYGFAFTTNAILVVSPVLIWGMTNGGQALANPTIPPTATNVIAIAAGPSTDLGLPCMALRADGSIVPWGNFSRDPAAPTNAVDVVAISVGSSGSSANNLVVRADGTVVHWPVPLKPPEPALTPNSNFVAVAAGAAHQLALRDDGTVVAWGSNTYGQTNVPPEATNVVAIAAGRNHSLALRADGAVIGWGLNTLGQSTILHNIADVVSISAGGDQTLALRADGSAAGSIVTNSSPTALLYGSPPKDATNLLSISAGAYHSLAVRAGRTVASWGQTNFGVSAIPYYATNVLAVAAGGRLSLALVPDPAAPPQPPRVARPPLSRTVMAGQDAVFNAMAVGGPPLSYQWYRGGVLLANQTKAALALANVRPGDAGDYQFVATNEFGSVTSAVAVITVAIPQPQLLPQLWRGNGFTFTFRSIPGVLYLIEGKGDPAAGAWAELERRTGVGGVETVTDAAAGFTTRYYRVRAQLAPSP